jgi:YidC/Oxa1 family membrane protein insertase
MDYQRLFLFGALGLLLLVMWQQWQIDYGQGGQQAQQPQQDEQRASGDPDVPDEPVTADAQPDTAETSGPSDGGEAGADGQPTVAAGDERVLERGERIRVVTDLLDVTLDTVGGDVRAVRLRDYSSRPHSEERVQLMSDAPGRLFVAQSGLQAGDAPAPTHHARYRSRKGDYRLADDADRIAVPLTWSDDGVRVTKTYVFHRGSYAVDVRYRVANESGQAWTGRTYHQLQRQKLPDADKPTLLPAYFGPAYYTPEDKYQQLDYADLTGDEAFRREAAGGWTAMVEHYYLGAWLIGEQQRHTIYGKAVDADAGKTRYIIGSYNPGERVSDGSDTEFSSRLYLGPKETDDLAAAGQGLDLTIDYGYMTFLSSPLFVVLDWIHGYVGNWGWAIIILTLLIKLVFYKLSEKSYRSMAKMKQAQPKIQQIKERYGDDRDKMGRAMMDLYKKEQINPLGGCLPILVQIPVFIALYWMLLGSVELRHAEFMLWINDLSERDPYFVLPLLMGASMWLQQKLNPAPVDQFQQKIFMALPFVFTVFFAFFPSGLVLYWLTNNVLSIAQQYYITRYVVGERGTGSKKATS